jgi:microcystin-dependent protein
MALETGVNYISDLVSTNPASTDGLAQADDHLRIIKSAIQGTFPDVTNAVTSTHTELNIVDGDTAATATTLVDADRFVVNDDGTMVQVALTDLATYISANHSITQINGLTYPVADGSAGQFMTTDGAGTLSFTTMASVIAAGMLIPYAGSSAPTGWLMCYGQDVSRTTYSDLFTAIGITYGIGDGSTTFTLPDLRGRTIAGKDSMGGTSADRLTNQDGGLDGDGLGNVGGAETHQLTVAELAAHTHTDDLSPASIAGANYAAGITGVTGTDSQSGSTGGDSPHNNVQPTIILNYLIKT